MYPFFKIKTTCGSLAICLTSVLVTSAQDPEAALPFQGLMTFDSTEGSSYFGWESRYYLEGRDILSGDSVFHGSIDLAWKHLSAGIWYANSPDQPYDEMHLSLALTKSIGGAEFYVGYTHLRFPIDGAYDNEVGTGIAWMGPMEIGLSADVYYSFGAEGYFAELAASRDFIMSDELTLNVTVPLGFNQGYVSDGHDGVNHIALSAGLSYALSESTSISAHTTYSWALGRDADLPGDEQLIDFFHGGVGVEYSF